MFYVYVLESKKDDKQQYIGFTHKLDKRLKEHSSGKEVSTKPYAPWKCIYCEITVNEKDARRREKYFKTSQGRRFLKRRLKEYYYGKRRAS